MSKEEFLKIRTYVLKVHIHCDGCKQKVKKILQKIDGVYTTSVDAEQGKVTVSGNIEPADLIKRLAKSGKHAEIWGAPKPSNNNQNQFNNQIKNMQIDNGKCGKDNKSQKDGKEQPKGSLQQLQQQLQHMKGLGDMKVPQFKDLKGMMPFKDKKAVKFAEEDEFSDEDDEFDDEFDDYDDDDFSDDEDLKQPLTKMKPMMGNGQGGNGMMNGANLEQFLKSVGGGGGGKKGAVEIPVQIKGSGGQNDGKNGSGGKKGGGGSGSGGNQIQGDVAAKSGEKNGGGFPQDVKGGGFPQDVKGGAGGNNKVASNIPVGGVNNNNANGGKKGGKGEGAQVMNSMMHHGFSGVDVTHGLGGGNVGHMGNMPMTQMGNFPMSQMRNIPAVQGLPAAAMNAGGGGYFHGGAPPQYLASNQYEQQYMAAIMHQQHPSGMTYARPPPPEPYHPAPDPYNSYFNDENTNSCSVM